jgi:histidine triad (HIT) family protein
MLHGRLGQSILGLAFSRFPYVLPVRRVHVDASVLAFHHPFPSYPVHVLIVPRRRIAGLHALDPCDRYLLVEMLRAAQELKGSLNLPDERTWLVVNGGAYQDLPHLHIHLIVGNEAQVNLPGP